jgi:hypothetical protein
MVKMRCKTCSDVRFSAASDNLDCSCGGRFQVIPITQDEQITRLDESTIKLFNFTDIIKHDFRRKYN